MPRVLVTGAIGYIGTAPAPTLLNAAYRALAVDRLFFGPNLLEEHPDLERIKEDARCLRPERFEGVEAVIDLVAISNDSSGDSFRGPTWEMNSGSHARTVTLPYAAEINSITVLRRAL